MTLQRIRRAGICLLTAATLSLPIAVTFAAEADAAPSVYKNCTALQKKYPHGVGKNGAKDKVSGSSKPVTTFKRSTTIYQQAMKANKGLDRDRDGVACEKR